jgi:ferritin-like metal-binding protein YciE
MPLNSADDLFVYELAAMYDAEKKTEQIIGEAAGQVTDDGVAGMMRRNQQETQQQIANLEACFDLLGLDTQQIPCAVIDGFRTDYQMFTSQQPSGQVLAMFMIGSALKMEHYQVASYRGLIDKAILMGQTECAQLLQTNLVQEEEAASKLERIGHDLSQQVLEVA